MNLDEHMKFAMEQVFVTSDHHFGAWKLASNILRSPIFSQEEDTKNAEWTPVATDG